jgi:hypothetical protein
LVIQTGLDAHYYLLPRIWNLSYFRLHRVLPRKCFLVSDSPLPLLGPNLANNKLQIDYLEEPHASPGCPLCSLLAALNETNPERPTPVEENRLANASTFGGLNPSKNKSGVQSSRTPSLHQHSSIATSLSLSVIAAWMLIVVGRRTVTRGEALQIPSTASSCPHLCSSTLSAPPYTLFSFTRVLTTPLSQAILV